MLLISIEDWLAAVLIPNLTVLRYAMFCTVGLNPAVYLELHTFYYFQQNIFRETQQMKNHLKVVRQYFGCERTEGDTQHSHSMVSSVWSFLPCLVRD